MSQINAGVEGMHAEVFIIYADTSVIPDITMVSAVGGLGGEEKGTKRMIVS